jgi:hypothetical protein
LDGNHFLVSDKADGSWESNYWLINKDNEMITEKKNNKGIEMGNSALISQAGLIITSYGNERGVIDYDGKVILKNEYESVRIYDDFIFAERTTGGYDVIKR